MKSIAKITLLAIDDWGSQALTKTERADLLEILEDRQNLQSTIVTSQLPVKDHRPDRKQMVVGMVLDNGRLPYLLRDVAGGTGPPSRFWRNN